MDSELDTREFQRITVTLPVSVETCERVSVAEPSWRILVMGPTGAGKSTFIEALGCSSLLRISSNQLDGFTKLISTYRVRNVASDRVPIYLIDSPGFADTKISELEIVSMLKKWIQENGGMYFHRILYLTPVTRVRMPGSQRRALDTFQALTGSNTEKNITVVTTMWDSLWGENSMKRAETTFNQLRNEVWKDFIHKSNRVVKFHNTQQSALSILDGALDRGVPDYFQFENMVNYSQDLRRTRFAIHLYNDLCYRVQTLRLHRDNVLQEQAQLSAQTNPLLTSVLSRQLEDIEKDLARFEQELGEFKPPLDPLNGAAFVASSLSKTLSTSITADNSRLSDIQSSTPNARTDTDDSFIYPATPFPYSSSTTPNPKPGHHYTLTPTESLERHTTGSEEKWTGGRISRTVQSLKRWVVRWFEGTNRHPEGSLR